MLENIPSQKTMTELLGQSLFEIWQRLCLAIDENTKWNEYGILVGRIGSTSINIVKVGKTLCCLYAKNNCIGFMIIFGKDERTKFEKYKRYSFQYCL